jgi:hypothetical protein
VSGDTASRFVFASTARKLDPPKAYIVERLTELPDLSSTRLLLELPERGARAQTRPGKAARRRRQARSVD